MNVDDMFRAVLGIAEHVDESAGLLTQVRRVEPSNASQEADQFARAAAQELRAYMT